MIIFEITVFIQQSALPPTTRILNSIKTTHSSPHTNSFLPLCHCTYLPFGKPFVFACPAEYHHTFKIQQNNTTLLGERGKTLQYRVFMFNAKYLVKTSSYRNNEQTCTCIQVCARALLLKQYSILGGKKEIYSNVHQKGSHLKN